MIILGLPLLIIAIGFFCWLLFTLAVYALPFFVGLTAGLAAYHSGSGVIGAIVVGLIAGAVTLAIGQVAFAAVRSPLIRAAIALLFAAPAAIAGYHATLGLAHIAVPSATWQVVFAGLGGVAVFATAWARMWLFVPPDAGQAAAAGSGHLPLPSAAKEG